ncbi:hypothetical protein DER45DRAFT_520685 [Fusarium avenaceum]|nr:hypothetical protein DER45DRAFT_520685 [Fusarium avenaceum]
MAPSRAKSFSCLFVLVVGIVLCVFTSPVFSESLASQPSPNADVELICHTDNAKDCYPKVFQPTDEFQIVHDDQELPHGLHVRLNMSNGKKEAKINVPDEGNPALEGLPVDQAIVVVDQGHTEDPQIPKGAPAYEPIGKIKEPQGEEFVGKPFFTAIKMLKAGETNGGKEFDDALEGMEELSHDIYYGLKVTEDPAVLKALFCMMADSDVAYPVDITPRDHQAAAILGASLQNNAAALKEVTKQWTSLMEAQCPRTGKSLKDSLYSPLVPAHVPTSINTKTLASTAKAKVGAINGLMKSDIIRAEFLKNDGMKLLLEVLVPQGKEWETTQRKVGQLVLDTFLDEDMGAKPGQWPRTERTSDAKCRVYETSTDEGCWDYHVARILKENKRDSGHWSRDLHDRLAVLRKNGKYPPRVELHCFKPAEVRACSRCHAVSYCDAACQSANWTAVHSKECKVLRKVTEQGRPGLPTPVRAVIQALVKPEISVVLEDLEGNVVSWRNSEKWADMEMMAMGASSFAGLGTGQAEIQKALTLLCKIQTNAFHRYDADLGQVGIFLGPKLAMANHSCIPNAMVQFVGRRAILRAEKPIEVDQEIEISYTDYTFPLSKRTQALAPYFFDCLCLRCEKDLNVYQVCAASPVIDMNRHSLVVDVGKLGRHSAAKDSSKASAARRYSEELSDLLNEKDLSPSLETRRAALRARYQQCKGLVAEKLWAVSPLPQLLSEISILYAEEENFVYALVTSCFIAASCDPYRHVLPYHPIRIKGLLLVAKLLANTAADTASLGNSQAVASKGDFNQRALQTLQGIDQVSLCQMLLIMILKSVPRGYAQEWEVSITAKQMLDEINQLPGREQELSLINSWTGNPEADQARAFFGYAVVKQIDALADLGVEIFGMDFGQ